MSTTLSRRLDKLASKDVKIEIVRIPQGTPDEVAAAIAEAEAQARREGQRALTIRREYGQTTT
ncbi:hypothetical protein D5125_12905 [Magnetovirga frankeli]|uniref:hypothetical protein n=1 Tax=Magnetovirga frankeli TaxID=947516 RepID=UPI0012930122|nr:hypothetical protein D5125_12905 [gamma proteobacterium SS-5]